MHIKSNAAIDTEKFGQGPCRPNSELSWVSPDSEELFDKNQKDRSKSCILESAGWDKNSVIYRINDRGFRMDKNMRDILPGGGTFYLGDSITFGIGINIEDTWAWKHNQKIGGDFINLAGHGYGIEAQYRLLKSWTGVLKPKRAYTIGAFLSRREIIQRTDILRLGPWVTGKNIKIYQELIDDDRESHITFIRTLDGMRMVCLDHGIELYALGEDCFEEVIHNAVKPGDLPARDLLHWGKAWHSRLSNMCEESWKRLA